MKSECGQGGRERHSGSEEDRQSSLMVRTSFLRLKRPLLYGVLRMKFTFWPWVWMSRISVTARNQHPSQQPTHTYSLVEHVTSCMHTVRHASTHTHTPRRAQNNSESVAVKVSVKICQNNFQLHAFLHTHLRDEQVLPPRLTLPKNKQEKNDNGKREKKPSTLNW